MTTDNKRLPWASCELLVAFKFAELEYGVSTPLWPQPYDLVVDAGGLLHRVQVKLAQFRPDRQRKAGKGDREHYSVQLARRRGRQGARTNIRTDVGVFDWLVVVCAADRIYVIPEQMLRSALEPRVLQRVVIIKLPLVGRRDSARAGLRWEPYLNNFTLQQC